MNNNTSSPFSNPTGLFRKFIQQSRQAPIQVYWDKPHPYPELHLFKSQIELDGNGPLHKPYTSARSSALLYRTIFLSIGILYFILGIFLYSKSLTWTGSLLFGGPFWIKTFLLAVCTISSLYCIILGFRLRAENEAVKKAYKDSKARLANAHERKAVDHGIIGYTLFGREYRRSLALRQVYHEASEKLHEHVEETYLLVHRIARSGSFEEHQKEELLNQAILEFRDKADHIISSFKGVSPPILELT